MLKHKDGTESRYNVQESAEEVELGTLISLGLQGGMGVATMGEVLEKMTLKSGKVQQSKMDDPNLLRALQTLIYLCRVHAGDRGKDGATVTLADCAKVSLSSMTIVEVADEEDAPDPL